MSVSWKSLVCCASLALIVSGCQTETAPAAPTATGGSTVSAPSDVVDNADAGPVDSGESDIADAMGKLSAEERLAAEAQKYCAVSNSALLGSMGTPLKIDIKGESVFLCCSGCKSKATGNPDETLAAVAKLKADNVAVKN